MCRFTNQILLSYEALGEREREKKQQTFKDASCTLQHLGTGSPLKPAIPVYWVRWPKHLQL